jgi:hypothetical protein
MKKLIIGLSGVIVLALAVVLFVNAGTSTTDTKKATTEVKADCAKCPSAATCTDAPKSEAASTASSQAEGTEAKAPTKTCCPEAAQMTTAATCAGCPMKKPAATN